MAGAAQGDRTAGKARGGAAGIRYHRLGRGQWAVLQAFSRAAGVELSPINVRNTAEIERGTTEFAGAPNGGLIVVVTSAAQIHCEPIIAVAARHRLPAVYPYRSFVAAGGCTAARF